MESDDGQLVLRWDNAGPTTDALCDLLQRQLFVDIVISCQIYMVQAHKLVLAAHSKYLRDELGARPVHEIHFEGVELSVILSLVELIYRGETVTSEEDMKYLIAIMKLLDVTPIQPILDDCNFSQYIDDGLTIPLPRLITEQSPRLQPLTTTACTQTNFTSIYSNPAAANLTEPQATNPIQLLPISNFTNFQPLTTNLIKFQPLTTNITNLPTLTTDFSNVQPITTNVTNSQASTSKISKSQLSAAENVKLQPSSTITRLQPTSSTITKTQPTNTRIAQLQSAISNFAILIPTTSALGQLTTITPKLPTLAPKPSNTTESAPVSSRLPRILRPKPPSGSRKATPVTLTYSKSKCKTPNRVLTKQKTSSFTGIRPTTPEVSAIKPITNLSLFIPTISEPPKLAPITSNNAPNLSASTSKTANVEPKATTSNENENSIANKLRNALKIDKVGIKVQTVAGDIVIHDTDQFINIVNSNQSCRIIIEFTKPTNSDQGGHNKENINPNNNNTNNSGNGDLNRRNRVPELVSSPSVPIDDSGRKNDDEMTPIDLSIKKTK